MLTVLLVSTLPGCSALLIRAPNKRETPVQCSAASPLPWVDLGVLAALQVVAVSVAAAQTPLEPGARFGIGAGGLLGPPAVLLPSMLYGFGRDRQCRRLKAREQYPSVAISPERVADAVAPAVLETPAQGTRQQGCTDDQVREAAIQAMNEAGLKVVQTRPVVISELVRIPAGPCTRSLSIHVEPLGYGARVVGWVKSLGCNPTGADERLRKRVADRVEEHLRHCTKAPLEQPVLEPVGPVRPAEGGAPHP
ncbi:MAG: hypothetical protein QM765_29890 [Myxococcales bacterium]